MTHTLDGAVFVGRQLSHVARKRIRTVVDFKRAQEKYKTCVNFKYKEIVTVDVSCVWMRVEYFGPEKSLKICKRSS